MTALRFWLVTVFGLGLLRPAPGTWGSLPPPALVLGLLWLGAGGRTVNLALLVVAAVFGLGCAAFGRWAETRFGGKDPRQVVADETAGQSLALLFLPWRNPVDREAWMWNIALAATAFVVFRIFDVVKPPPARALQRLEGGWGILLDDISAGLEALLVTHLLAWLLWPHFIG